MKKLFLSFMLIFVVACNTTQPQKCKIEKTTSIKVIVTKNGKKVATIPAKDLKNLHNLAKKYLAMKGKIKGKVLADKDVKIKKLDGDLYQITVPLNKEISMVMKLRVYSGELKELRRIMKNLTTKQPKMTVKRVNKSDTFKVTMEMENIKWVTVIEAENLQKFHWDSFWKGAGMAGIVAALSAFASGGSSAAISPLIKFFIIPLL